VPRRWVACPQCDERVELDRGPRPIELSGREIEPEVIATRCELCIAWIRIEGVSEWWATHYSMTPFRDSLDALRAFPEGTWFAAADAKPHN
jgi:hypothetical protein